MNTYSPEAFDQLANAFYRQLLGIVEVNEITPPKKAFIPEIPVADIRRNHFIQSIPMNIFKSGSLEEPGLEYYFLKQPPALNWSDAENKAATTFDVRAIRKDFPLLEQNVNGHQIIWFDNAATTQKPYLVIDALSQYYREINSNVHRGAHTMAAKATHAYESAREKTQNFLGAASPLEIIFLRGTTEAINLVAQSYGGSTLGKGDEVLITEMEHHSNIVPWQLLSESTGAVLRVIPITADGQINIGEYQKLLSKRTRIISLTHVSNVLGTINPIRTIIEMAHAYGARVLVDGAQSTPHLPINVQALDADFYTFSGHKIYGPTGIGVLYGKKDLLEEMPPWQGGGSMIKEVTLEKTTYNELPYKFEAGTGNIADAVGLGVAIDYLRKIGLASIEQYEKDLTAYAMNKLSEIPGLRLFGTSSFKAGVISFLVDGIHPADLGQILDQRGIAVRVGHHCAQPLMRYYGVDEMLRVSLGLYNTKEEVDILVETIRKTKGHSS